MQPWRPLSQCEAPAPCRPLFPPGRSEVLITGPWQEASNNYSCLFDQISVPASLIQPGVLRCYCPGEREGRLSEEATGAPRAGLWVSGRGRPAWARCVTPLLNLSFLRCEGVSPRSAIRAISETGAQVRWAGFEENLMEDYLVNPRARWAHPGLAAAGSSNQSPPEV